MNVPGNVRLLLSAALENRYLQGPFQAFALQYEAETLVNFVNETAQGKSYKERLFDYVELVYTRGAILKLINAFWNGLTPAQQEEKEAKDFDAEFRKLYVPKNGQYELNKEHFLCPLVSSVLAFVDREILREKLYAMIDNKAPRIAIIDGKPKSGLSFPRYYLSEVSGSTKFFEFVQVDMYKNVKGYSDNGLVKAEHIAKHIADSLKMNYNVASFKISPFINTLKAFLSERGSICLFFFHQFNVAMDVDDVHDFMLALCEMVLVDRGNCYVVITGYTQTGNLPYDMTNIINPIDIGLGSFTRDQVKEFYRHAYKELLKIKDVDFTEEQLLQKVENELPAQFFVQANESNVTQLGRHLSDWYKKISA